MGILAWILLGLVAGAIAELIVGGPGGFGPIGLIITCCVGIVGAFIGGFIGSRLGWGTVTDFDIRSVCLAIFGAIVFLIILRAVRGTANAV